MFNILKTPPTVMRGFGRGLSSTRNPHALFHRSILSKTNPTPSLALASSFQARSFSTNFFSKNSPTTTSNTTSSSSPSLTGSFKSYFSTTSTDTTTTADKKSEYENIIIEDADNYNRWFQVPFAFVNHMCMGSVFAWSMLNDPMSRILGVVVPATNDWGLQSIALTFSLIMGGFVWAALVAKRVDRMGPRKSCLVGAGCLGGGFGLAALAIQQHNIYLLYLAGTIWGVSNSFSYVQPVTTLLKWFPDRKGFASGACIMGFGAGAGVIAPVYANLPSYFAKVPTYLGQVGSEGVTLINEGGKLFANYAGQLQEVVVATSADVATSSFQEGVYLVGTGSTGLAETLLVIGGTYSVVMALCALGYRLPRAGFIPKSATTTVVDATPDTKPTSAEVAKPEEEANSNITKFNVDGSVALRTNQFWLMWVGFGLSITGCYGVIAMGKTMLSEAFGMAYPGLVTAAFATFFVGCMSTGNLAGRILWPNLSDYWGRSMGGDPFWGRKRAFAAMWGMVPFCYLGSVWAIHQCADAGDSVMPVAVFTIAVAGVLSVFGGTAATRPAIVGDIFGTKNVGVITATQMTVVAPAAFMGPKLTTYLRERSTTEAIYDLAQGVDSDLFIQTFGMGKDGLPLLIQAKTVTINRLLELNPGAIDPSPFVYDQALYVSAGLSVGAFITNSLVKPVDKKYHTVELASTAALNHANSNDIEATTDFDEVVDAEEIVEETDKTKSN